MLPCFHLFYSYSTHLSSMLDVTYGKYSPYRYSSL
uniref:Uncharacterized protein n=1 Tax=Arundo donax TaxID=35708 RepID=A0A0A9AWZ3_ARUDO